MSLGRDAAEASASKWPNFVGAGMASAGSRWPIFAEDTNGTGCPGGGAWTAEGIPLRPGEAHAEGEANVFSCSGLSLWRLGVDWPSAGLPRP